MKTKKSFYAYLFLIISGYLSAQSGQFNGNWALCKIVTTKGDTQSIAPSDKRYITYSFTYNNTFTSFRKEKNEEINGRWGYEFKTKTIKIKNPMNTKTHEAIGDYDLKTSGVTADSFVEVKEEKKKIVEYYIYCKTK